MPAAKQTVNCEEGVARGALILRPAHPSYWRECGRLCRHPAAGAGAPCGGGQVDEPEPPWDRVFDRVVTCVTNVEASVRSRARVAETSRSCGRRMCWSDVRPIGRTSNSVLDGGSVRSRLWSVGRNALRMQSGAMRKGCCRSTGEMSAGYAGRKRQSNSAGLLPTRTPPHLQRRTLAGREPESGPR